MLEIQKSGDKTSSGEIGLDIRTHASPKVGQDQVSGGVSVPCRHATPVANALWKPIFSNNVKVGKKSNQGKVSYTGVMYDGVLVVSTREHLQIQNGTGPGVRRSKRPLLACRTRCICSMETLHN